MPDDAGAPEAGETFETVYHGLEYAVGQLEAGGLSLEESIRAYETGMRLALRCREMLDAAELRVSELEEELSSREAREPRRISEETAGWLNGNQS